MGSSLLASLSERYDRVRGRRGEKLGAVLSLTNNWRRFPGAWLFFLLALTAGCGGSSSGPLSVSISPGGAVVPLGGTQTFAATVSNDPKNQGVTWTLTANGVSCSPSCGTVSPTSSASGTSVTYSAPGTATSVTLTATTVSDTAVLASAIITVTGSTAISVSPNTASVALSGTQQFVATVAGDTSNKGVNWTLAQNGVACSPSCGTVSPASTANGVATTYTAPAATPPSNAAVTLTASSIAFPGSTAWATITIGGGITISVAPSYVANVPVNGTQQVVATVTNDTSNKGVTWTLTANGQSCSPGCGSISPTSTASGAATTYTAPGTPTTVTVTATSVADTAASSYATLNVLGVSVSVAPTVASVHAGDTLTLDALVSDDVKKAGVTWTLTANGQPCSPGCGTISPTSTGSGVTTTYTTPSSVSNAEVVMATATSVTDTKQSASTTINLYPPISVSVSPSSASVAVNSRTTFTATVANDFSNSGVTWTLLQSGKACSPGCGTVSPTSTASGVATTYFAPSTVPSPSQVTLTASSAVEVGITGSATISVGSSAIAAKFAGDYALQFSGYDAGGAVAMAGEMTTDGAGNVTGMEDSTRPSGIQSGQAFTGTYTIGPDGRGSFTLTNSSDGAPLGTFQFALDSAARQAPFAELDLTGERGEGMLARRNLPTSAAGLSGDFSFGVAGTGPQGERVAMAGRFHADGAGKISAGLIDMNDGGNYMPSSVFTGSYTLEASGRGTLEAETPLSTLHWTFYVISASRIFLVCTGSRYLGPIASGSAMAQATSQAGAFSAVSLTGTYVLHFAGADRAGTTNAGAGLVTFDGTGGLRYTIDQNTGGHVQSSTGAGSYMVAASGRAELQLGEFASPMIFYLAGPNEGVVVGSGASASSGLLEAQSPGPFDNGSLVGNYTLRTANAAGPGTILKWGQMSTSTPGLIQGSFSAIGAGDVEARNSNFTDTYSLSPVGRAKLGSGLAVLYEISPSHAVILDLTPGETSPGISQIVH